jgi:hypothetical protein
VPSRCLANLASLYAQCSPYPVKVGPGPSVPETPSPQPVFLAEVARPARGTSPSPFSRLRSHSHGRSPASEFVGPSSPVPALTDDPRPLATASAPSPTTSPLWREQRRSPSCKTSCTLSQPSTHQSNGSDLQISAASVRSAPGPPVDACAP